MILNIQKKILEEDAEPTTTVASATEAETTEANKVKEEETTSKCNSQVLHKLMLDVSCVFQLTKDDFSEHE